MRHTRQRSKASLAACFFFFHGFYRRRQEFGEALPNQASMTKLISNSPPTKSPLTRRELARQALAGTAGVLLAAALPAHAQVVDPAPAAPPLPTSSSAQNATMPTTHTEVKTGTEGEILTRLVPVAAGYALSETQAKEAADQLKDYPGGFAKARAYVLPDSVGPAFAADAPARKERAK